MRRWLYGLLALFATVLTRPTGASAQQVVVDGSAASTHVVVGADGATYVGVWITAPEVDRRHVDRPPMDLSLVIDVSGSMAGEKMQNARIAAQSAVESLRDGDILSIYAFSDDVYELSAPVVIGAGTRGELIRRIGELRDLGSTNLYGGLAAGIARMQQAPASHAVRRVVLISDGHANVGPSDPGSLGNLASGASEARAQVTAIGVGLDYDEQTLGQLAVRSAGRLYHLAQPSQMASILREEMGLLANTVATDVVIEVAPAPGVVILEGLSMGSRVERGHLVVPVGTLVAGQRREVLFRARLDTAAEGARTLATARVAYRGATDAARVEATTAAIPITVTRDGSAASRSRSSEVAAMVATYDASQASLAAARAIEQGNLRAAEAQFAAAERSLDEAQAAAPAAVAAELRDRRDRVRQARRAAATAAAPSASGGAPAPSAARGAALDAYDAAYALEAY